MKTVAVVSQKGGSGTTTLAVHLATAAATAGHVAAIIDLDPQATAASWGDDRAGEGPEVISGQAVRLPALMADRARERGLHSSVLDTAPNADQTASLAARAADLVLIPCRPARFDLEAIETTLLLTRAAGKPAYVVLNAGVLAARRHRPGGCGRPSGAGRAGCPAPARGHRAAFSYGVIDGWTAQEIQPRGKAAQGSRKIYTRGCVVLWTCLHAHML